MRNWTVFKSGQSQNSNVDRPKGNDSTNIKSTVKMDGHESERSRRFDFAVLVYDLTFSYIFNMSFNMCLHAFHSRQLKFRHPLRFYQPVKSKKYFFVPRSVFDCVTLIQMTAVAIIFEKNLDLWFCSSIVSSMYIFTFWFPER